MGGLVALDKITFAILIERAVKAELSPKESDDLREELRKRFKENTYESYLERIILSAYVLYDIPTSRDDYIKKAVAIWRNQKLFNPLP